MSGGHFDYQQYKISEIADEIQRLIDCNHNIDLNEWGDPIGTDFSDDVVSKLQEAVVILRKAAIYVQRIDYLVCSDDSPESFLKRLEEELLEEEHFKPEGK